MQVSRVGVVLAAGILLSVVTSPTARPVRAPARTSNAEMILSTAAQGLTILRADGQVQRRARFAHSKNRVVASSMLARGVRFVRVRRQSPPQQVVVTVVSPHAQIHAVHVKAGPDRAPFATVSSAVKRTHALAGINGLPMRLDGEPMLVREGRVVPPPQGPPGVRHPRTGVGLTRDGSALFVTVDGRRAAAVGMTPREFAVFMRSLGATWAVNLDGGASTTMVAHGEVMNSPSDPLGERSVSHVVVLLAHGRPGMFQLGAQLHALDRRVDPAGPGSIRNAEGIHAFYP